MLDDGFMPLHVQLEWQKHGTRECAIATKGKTVVLVTACYKCCLHYAQSVKVVIRYFGFTTHSCGSQLNTSEMFWIRYLKVDDQ